MVYVLKYRTRLHIFQYLRTVSLIYVNFLLSLLAKSCEEHRPITHFALHTTNTVMRMAELLYDHFSLSYSLCGGVLHKIGSQNYILFCTCSYTNRFEYCPISSTITVCQENKNKSDTQKIIADGD